MRKDQILQTAISKNISLRDIGGNCSSAFSAVHQCISTIDLMDLEEEKKKEKLIGSLQSFWYGKSFYIAGSKREQIQKIVELAFGIKKVKNSCLSTEINSFTFQDLYLYFCYVEQIAKGDDLSHLLFDYYKNKRKETTIQNMIEIQLKKQEKEEEEKRKVKEMGEEERWKHEIFERQCDIQYFQKLDSDGEYKLEDKIRIAKLLEEYWKLVKKWEGDKISEKQRKKISKVKEILGKEKE